MSDLFAAAPDYHEGRKPYSKPSESSTIPEFTLDRRSFGEEFVAEFVEVTCARCKGEFLIPVESGWQDHHGETRPCPHCFVTSRIP
jgi:hypothetical protein